MPERKYISLDDAAQILGVSTRHIRRLIAAGDLPAYRAGSRMIRLRVDEVEGILRPIPTAGGAR